MGRNVLAVGEIGDSRRLAKATRVFASTGAVVDSVGVVVLAIVDDGDDSASNAWILDWSNADGMGESRAARATFTYWPWISTMSTTNQELYAVAGEQFMACLEHFQLINTPLRLLSYPDGNKRAIRKRFLPRQI